MVATKMSRSFLERMRKFEETFLGLRGRAHFPREEGMITPEMDRERCIKALDALSAAWAQDPRDLAKLRELTERSLEHFAQGDADAGASAAKRVDEFLFGIRDQLQSGRN
jgi:hypothetical protein